MAVYKPFWSFSPWGGQEHRNCGWTVRAEADKATSCSPFQAHFKNIHSNSAKTTCKNTAAGKRGLMVSLICQIILVHLSSNTQSRGLWVNICIAIPEPFQNSFQGCQLYLWTPISTMLQSPLWTKLKRNTVIHLSLQPRPWGGHVSKRSFFVASPSQTQTYWFPVKRMWLWLKGPIRWPSAGWRGHKWIGCPHSLPIGKR